MSEVIRFLVEAYYDVQELRKAAFNRIVAYAKANMEKLQSQPQGETQSKCASHSTPETQQVSASQRLRETHLDSARSWLDSPEELDTRAPLVKG